MEKEDIKISEEYSSIDKEEQLFVYSAEEKAFLKKLNWKILPIVFLIIFIQVGIAYFCFIGNSSY